MAVESSQNTCEIYDISSSTWPSELEPLALTITRLKKERRRRRGVHANSGRAWFLLGSSPDILVTLGVNSNLQRKNKSEYSQRAIAYYFWSTFFCRFWQWLVMLGTILGLGLLLEYIFAIQVIASCLSILGLLYLLSCNRRWRLLLYILLIAVMPQSTATMVVICLRLNILLEDDINKVALIPAFSLKSSFNNYISSSSDSLLQHNLQKNFKDEL